MSSEILDKLDKLNDTLRDIAQSLKAIADQYCSASCAPCAPIPCNNPCCKKNYDVSQKKQSTENGYSYFE